MLERDSFGPIRARGFVCRILRLTLLAPEIVKAILAGRHRGEMDLAMLMRPFPVDWREQWDAFRLIT
jgi:hypothetical protein